MKYAITLEIEAGENTCAVEPGKFCRFCLNGPTSSKCWLFAEKLYDKDGWIQRCVQCLSQAETMEEK